MSIKSIPSFVFVLLIGFGSVGWTNAQVPQNEFYSDGQLKARYSNLGSNVIQVTYFYDDGAVRETGFFKDNQNHGHWVSYDTLGKKTTEGLYHNSNREGSWRFWDVDGEVHCVIYYNHNRITATVIAEK